MFRKRTLAVAAAISLGASAITPCPAADLRADPNVWHPRPRLAWGPRFCNGVPVSFGYGLCYQSHLLQTPWGPRWRLVNECW